MIDINTTSSKYRFIICQKPDGRSQAENTTTEQCDSPENTVKKST